MPEIIPSILVKTKEEFKKQADAIKESVSMVQLDIADGIFVDNTTWAEPEDVGELLEVDCELHLMVQNPLEEARTWEQVQQIKRVLVHYESDPDHIAEILAQIHSYAWEVGIVLNIETPIDVINEIVEEIDAVQFMSVHPGKQHQEFLPEVLDKIKEFHGQFPNIPISVDGHVNAETLPELIKAGATRFGPGSAVFGNDKTPKENVEELNTLIHTLTQ